MRKDPKSVSDYALIGDLQSAALIHRNGTIEWFCAPRFDSASVFTAMLGDESNGYWRVAPQNEHAQIKRRYIKNTLVLETIFRTATGSIRLIDFMAMNERNRTIVRIVEGIEGSVDCTMALVPVMQYGSVKPHTKFEDNGWVARFAPQALHLRASINFQGSIDGAHATFTIRSGESVHFTLQAFPSYETIPETIEARHCLEKTRQWWLSWSGNLQFDGEWRDTVIRSAIVLKALCFEPTGAFVAAVTTSLPEDLGGSKNWDYRYCWLRDASFTIEALLTLGSTREAIRWRSWIQDACGGNPELLKIMYQVDGQALPDERTLPWLAGFDDSQPVRISNGAHHQFQLGVYGDILRMLAHAQDLGIECTQEDWAFVESLMRYVEFVWQRPGNGIWETRSGGRQYVDSKVMSWLAIDRGLHIAAQGGFATDLTRWSNLRSTIHEQVCRAGFDPLRNTFTQYYGSIELDASVLLIPIVGFLPPNDSRVLGTIAAIERHLMVDGHVYRYSADDPQDGFPNEGSFLMCGFWLVEAYEIVGRFDDARALYERLSSTANDVGIFGEEFDTGRHITIGNIPQAFSHVGAIRAAYRLAQH